MLNAYCKVKSLICKYARKRIFRIRIWARAFTYTYNHRQMFVRPETIDRPTHERPSNKTFFSLCDVCITNCLASTIFLSIVILIPVRFPSTGRTECERAAARGELFCHQLISSNMTSRCNKRGIQRANLPLNTKSLSSPRSKYLKIHCDEIIIFIARYVFV